MNKLQRIYNDMDDGATFIKRNKLTPAEYYAMQELVCELANEKSSTTIMDAVRSVFAKYGFTVVPEGIGWRITLGAHNA